MGKNLIFLLLFCFYQSCSSNKITYNLAPNSSFEVGQGEEPDGWIKMITKDVKSYHLGISRKEYHSGLASYEIGRIWCYPLQETGIQTTNSININYGKKYLLSFWYKTKDIDEYTLALVSQFKVKCDSSPTVTYRKYISNSDEWKQYFILLDNIPHDARKTDISFFCRMRTKGRIWIDDVEFKEASKKDIAFFENWRRQPIPAVLGEKAIGKFTASGYFRIEKDDTRWWYVDPNGDAYWAIGVVGSGPNINLEENQSEWFKKTYGSTKAEVLQKSYDVLFDDCGFNALAGFTSKDLSYISDSKYNEGKPYMSMTYVLNLSDAGNVDVYAKDKNGKSLNNNGHWVVDPYNPTWRNMAKQKAEKLITDYKDKPWFAGWYVDNEMNFDDLFRFIWSDYSSKEFVKMLQAKYKKIEDLNNKWSSGFTTYNYKSFNDILSEKPEPKDWDDPSFNDFAAFERQMLGEYITYTYNLVKGLDPEHLVISNRMHTGALPHLYRSIDLWGKYDIVCMNIYPQNNLIGFDRGELEIMKKLHEGTKRPIIIGEWSVPAIDSKLYEFGKDPYNRPLDWSWPQVLRTQKERGEAYEICIKQLASLDFVIGAGWFKTTDVDSKERRANRGLMNNNAELYQELIDAMKKSNNDIKKKMGLKW